MLKADALDRRERWGSIMKKAAMGMAGAAALCIMIFLGFSMGPQFNSSDSSKMSGQKNDTGAAYDMDTKESAPYYRGKLVVETADGAIEEITDKAKIDKVAEILGEAEWEDAKMQMATPPDFKLDNQYYVWVGPGKDHLEIIMDGENKYTKLPKESSAELYELITGKKLGE